VKVLEKKRVSSRHLPFLVGSKIYYEEQEKMRECISFYEITEPRNRKKIKRAKSLYFRR